MTGNSTMNILAWIRTLFRRSPPIVYREEERKIFAASSTIGWAVVGFGLFGLLTIAGWSYGIVPAPPVSGPTGGAGGFSSKTFFTFFGADLLVAAAAAAAGSLFGFIFGIPRTQATLARTPDRAGSGAASHAVLVTNTNLERISDWLTTLLIGATLVQIRDIVHWIGNLGGKLLNNGVPTNDAIVSVIVVYFFALAFLGIYLITRLYLTFAFRQTLEEGSGTLLDARIEQLDFDLKLGTPDALNDAIRTYSLWTFSSGEKDDPKLNATIARILIKLIASRQAATPRSENVAALKQAISKAAADPTIKTQLKADVNSGQLKTGDNSLDAEIETDLR
jgi:hypothetical protein